MPDSYYTSRPRTLAIVTGTGTAWFTLLMLFGSDVLAAATEEPGATNRLLSVIPFIRNNPCTGNRYHHVAASVPLAGTSDGGEGHPWRAMYGLCVAEKRKLTLHQDWVVSYFDAKRQGDSPGGKGVSFGTDFSLLWQHRRTASVTPYYELGGGIQYAAGTPFPAHGSRWMFTINAGAGLLVPLKPNLQMKTALRYLHISNAGLFPDNAGYDAIHLLIAVTWNR